MTVNVSVHSSIQRKLVSIGSSVTSPFLSLSDSNLTTSEFSEMKQVDTEQSFSEHYSTTEVSDVATQKDGKHDSEQQKKTPVQIFKCPICGVEFRNRKCNLKRHIESKHSKVRNFLCPVATCGRRFHRKQTLERHVARLHSQFLRKIEEDVH